MLNYFIITTEMLAKWPLNYVMTLKRAQLVYLHSGQGLNTLMDNVIKN